MRVKKIVFSSNDYRIGIRDFKLLLSETDEVILNSTNISVDECKGSCEINGRTITYSALAVGGSYSTAYPPYFFSSDSTTGWRSGNTTSLTKKPSFVITFDEVIEIYGVTWRNIYNIGDPANSYNIEFVDENDKTIKEKLLGYFKTEAQELYRIIADNNECPFLDVYKIHIKPKVIKTESYGTYWPYGAFAIDNLSLSINSAEHTVIWTKMIDAYSLEGAFMCGAEFVPFKMSTNYPYYTLPLSGGYSLPSIFTKGTGTSISTLFFSSLTDEEKDCGITIEISKKIPVDKVSFKVWMGDQKYSGDEWEIYINDITKPLHSGFIIDADNILQSRVLVEFEIRRKVQTLHRDNKYYKLATKKELL